ncbi:MAG TPA: hypothetical protein DDY68_05295, partial [Porphyromonadaceae bacterium]|nr:hypothetical protein [Porphyromonadaceae bacterium]
FDFRLKYAFCGGGPYDPVATIDWYFAQEGHKVQYAVAGPLILKGQISGNPDLFSSVKYEDYLTDSYKNSGIDTMYNAPKSNTTAKINSAIETKFGNRSLDNIFKPELFTQYTESSGVLATPLIESLKRNVLTDGSWFPKTPMWLFHVENDKVVPFVNFEHAKVAWGGRGVLQTSTCTVGGAETALLGDEHTTGGYKFYIQVLLNPTVNPQD